MRFVCILKHGNITLHISSIFLFITVSLRYFMTTEWICWQLWVFCRRSREQFSCKHVVCMCSFFRMSNVVAGMFQQISKYLCIQFNIEHAWWGSFPQERVSMVGCTTLQYVDLPFEGLDGEIIYPCSRILFCCAGSLWNVKGVCKWYQCSMCCMGMWPYGKQLLQDRGDIAKFAVQTSWFAESYTCDLSQTRFCWSAAVRERERCIYIYIYIYLCIYI